MMKSPRVVAGAVLLASCGGEAESPSPPPFGVESQVSIDRVPNPAASGGAGYGGGCAGARCGAGASGAGGASVVGGAGGASAAGGSGGVTAVDGPGGQALLPDPVSVTYPFTTGLDGFAVNYYCTSLSTLNCSMVFPQPPAADAGAGEGTNDFVSWQHDAGPGLARLTIQFIGAGSVDFARNFAPLDLRHKRVTARMLLESGPVGTTAKLYLKSGTNYVYADAGELVLPLGEWWPVSFPNSSAGYVLSGFDMSDVREIGMEIAASPVSLTPAVVYIDSIEY